MNDKEIIPELVQKNCTIKNIFHKIESLLLNKDKLQEQLNAYKHFFIELGADQEKAPSIKAAHIIYNLINNNSSTKNKF
jgi:lipid A disaccharide synthetase